MNSSKIIRITSIQQARPIKGQWYDYYGDIFVSVIPRKKAHHIRRKISESSNKKDSRTSEWHLKWQYEIIEAKYGIPMSNTRTYEQVVYHNGEKHVIDSLVDNKIAVEFQHSLGVDTEEMDKRHYAHRALGFQPYLVLDFTNSSFKKFSARIDSKVIAKLEKWLDTEYYHNNGLFVEFKCSMIWMSKAFYRGFYKLESPSFENDLLNLQTRFSEIKDIQLAEKKEREIRAVRKEEERAIQQEWDRKQELVDRKFRNREEKFKSEEYKYFRKCYQNGTIRVLIDDRGKELFNYRSYIEDYDGKCHEKFHIYQSEDSNLCISYSTFSTYSKESYHTRWGQKESKKFTYRFATVIISEGNEIIAEFYIENGITKVKV